MIKKQTPIENILFDFPFLKDFAIALCEKHGIRTAEQLATYNRFAFKIGGNFRNHPKAYKYEPRKITHTISYLKKCLKRIGMEFSPEHPQAESRKGSPHEIYGKENIKTDILNAMRETREYVSMTKTGIARQAKRALIFQLLPYEIYKGRELFDARTFASSVFELRTINPYFDELVEEGKAERFETKKGIFYRTKENKMIKGRK